MKLKKQATIEVKPTSPFNFDARSRDNLLFPTAVVPIIKMTYFVRF